MGKTFWWAFGLSIIPLVLAFFIPIQRRERECATPGQDKRAAPPHEYRRISIHPLAAKRTAQNA